MTFICHLCNTSTLHCIRGRRRTIQYIEGFISVIKLLFMFRSKQLELEDKQGTLELELRKFMGLNGEYFVVPFYKKFTMWPMSASSS